MTRSNLSSSSNHASACRCVLVMWRRRPFATGSPRGGSLLGWASLPGCDSRDARITEQATVTLAARNGAGGGVIRILRLSVLLGRVTLKAWQSGTRQPRTGCGRAVEFLHRMATYWFALVRTTISRMYEATRMSTGSLQKRSCGGVSSAERLCITSMVTRRTTSHRICASSGRGRITTWSIGQGAADFRSQDNETRLFAVLVAAASAFGSSTVRGALGVISPGTTG